MKVKDSLKRLKENDVNEDSEIEITRFFDKILWLMEISLRMTLTTIKT